MVLGTLAPSAVMVNKTGVEIPLTMEEGNPLNVWHYLSHNDESMNSTVQS